MKKVNLICFLIAYTVFIGFLIYIDRPVIAIGVMLLVEIFIGLRMLRIHSAYYNAYLRTHDIESKDLEINIF